MLESQPRKSKAYRIDHLLTTYMALAVPVGILQWAEGHHVRAVIAGTVFLVLIPWLGKKWIDRAD